MNRIVESIVLYLGYLLKAYFFLFVFFNFNEDNANIELVYGLAAVSMLFWGGGGINSTK